MHGLYWPGNKNSGVTVGPGYDMGGRTIPDVMSDLKSIGIDQGIMAKVAQGVGLQGTQAGQFASAHKKLLDLNITPVSTALL